MLMDLTARFSKLGDPVLLLLGALGIFFYLWSDDERRILARPWATAFAACVLLTLLGKFVFHLVRWNEGGSLRLLSPSGHVAIGIGFYGSAAVMLTAGRDRTARLVVWVGTAVLLCMLAASRLILGLHSVPEIVIAVAIGAASLVLFILYLKNIRPVPVNAGHVVSLFVLIFGAYVTRHLYGESVVIRVVRAIAP